MMDRDREEAIGLLAIVQHDTKSYNMIGIEA